MDWGEISKEEGLTERFMKEYAHVLDWYHISRWIPLSKEEFIEEMQDYIDWLNISWNRILSEEFMENFKDRLVWYYICSFQQHLSYEFIKRNISYITIPTLQKNKYVQFTEEEWDELRGIKR